jgi:hypothetical protein
MSPNKQEKVIYNCKCSEIPFQHGVAKELPPPLEDVVDDNLTKLHADKLRHEDVDRVEHAWNYNVVVSFVQALQSDDLYLVEVAIHSLNALGLRKYVGFASER